MTDRTLELIFEKGRTYTAWIKKPVSDALLKEIYDLAKMGPTSANCCPMRIVFVKSETAKAKLEPFLDAGNVNQTMEAPVTAIFAYDYAFYDNLPFLFPHADARSWYVSNKPLIEDTAFRNGTLGAAYFMMAARALGLDCGPMSGFNQKGVNQAFFSGTAYHSNFLCNLGYGDPSKLHPRLPRIPFEDDCKIT